MLVHDEVRTALDAGRPVVALESTIIAHGLPRPDNLARRAGDRGRRARARRGAGDDRDPRRRGAGRARRRRARGARRRPTTSPSAACATSRRCSPAAATARRPSPPPRTSPSAPASACSPPAGSAASTAARARRSTSRPTSARSRASAICVVCAGVKSILDVPATLERLETLNVTVLGYRTDTFPALLSHRLRAAGAVAGRLARARPRRCCARATALGAPGGGRGREPARTSSSTRSCTTACCARASRRRPRQGITRHAT